MKCKEHIPPIKNQTFVSQRIIKKEYSIFISEKNPLYSQTSFVTAMQLLVCCKSKD